MKTEIIFKFLIRSNLIGLYRFKWALGWASVKMTDRGKAQEKERRKSKGMKRSYTVKCH
jgi:hypothetical protein